MYSLIIRLPLLVLVILLFSACSFKTSRITSTAPLLQSETTPAILTEAEARLRSSLITDASYEIYLDITDQSAKTYSGRVAALINLSRTDLPVRMDFNGGEIHRLLINESPVNPDYDGHYLSLPANRLQPGANMIEIEYTHPYSQDGEGLHRFRDPEDDRVYLYSNFEPYSANLLFPHFDQPDLKGTFKLTVRAPEDWQVVSATRERQAIKDGKHRWWHFPATQPISSYVFSLHAGPYKIWEDKDFRIPLRLMARQSRAGEIEPEIWFKLTRQGFDFYEEYFDIPYPYRKYDQLIVPEFNIGAMENVAAVTYSERRFAKQAMTEHDKMNLAHVILHEQAHMWFGNLVTMKWWDGLWLNESFADYMAYLAIVEGAGKKEGWHRFFDHLKLWAYGTDSRITTHPIASDVRDSNEAFLNFDGITYGKGAAVLKQLSHYLGQDAFRQGIREYLKLHQQENTELKDFTRALEKASGLELKEWTKEWLQTSGVNSVQTEFQCKDGLLKKLELHQFFPPQGDRVLRSQALNVGLYRLKKGGLILNRTIPVMLKGKRTKVDVPGQQPCPAFVYPNTDDWGYLQVKLSPEDQKTLLQHAALSPLLRSMIWSHLQDNFHKGQLSLTVMLETLQKRLPDEENNAVLRQKISLLEELFIYLQRFAGSLNDRSEKHSVVTGMLLDIQEFVWHQFYIAEPDSDRQQLWFDAYRTVSHSRRGLQRLADMLDERLVLPGLAITQTQRWSMIIALNKFGFSGAWQRVSQEKAIDQSSQGRSFALMADAARPDLTIKRQWLNKLQQPAKDTSQADTAVMSTLLPPAQNQIALELSEEILEGLKQINGKSLTLQAKYGASLIVNQCSAAGVQRLEKALKQNSSTSPVIIKALKEKTEQTRKCLTIRNKLMNP